MTRNVFDNEAKKVLGAMDFPVELGKSLVDAGAMPEQIKKLATFLARNPDVEISDVHTDNFEGVVRKTFAINFDPLVL